MNLRLGSVVIAALLLLQFAPLSAQIPASELPPPGTDTGLEGKYDPQNGIAQVARGEAKGVAIIFQDDHVVVFMPPDPVIAPGHVLVVPKRLGARNLLDLKPDEMRDLLVAVQKAAIAQKNGLGATGFRVQQNNGSAAAKPFTMPIFMSSRLLVAKRMELPRQEESCRSRSITR